MAGLSLGPTFSLVPYTMPYGPESGAAFSAKYLKIMAGVTRLELATSGVTG